MRGSASGTLQLLGELPRMFYEEVEANFTTACERTGETVDRDYAIAGHTFRLRFAGRGLVPRIARALAHLEQSSDFDAKPELTVHLWDAEECGVGVPMNGKLLSMLESDRLKVCSNARFHAFHEDWLGVDSVIDQETSRAFYCCKSVAELPMYETTAPLRGILGAWLGKFGLQIVHAAAVGMDGGGVVLVGESGSGKSTTAITALEGGMKYVSDDLCVVGASPSPTAFCLYNTIKLRTDAAARFSQWSPRLTRYVECGEEKAIAFLHEQRPEQVAFSFPVRALLLPQVRGGSGSKTRRTTWQAAMRALVPWSLRQVPGSGKKNIDLMFRFVATLPVFDLDLGIEHVDIVQRLVELLD